jgi:multidrug efflux system membrane fusion protein
MRRFARILLPIAVLVICGLIGYRVIKTAPEPKRFTPPSVIPVVEIVRVQPQAYTVILESQGTVQPRTESTLIPEVSGRVITIEDHFREGGFFEAGELLVEIDNRNYANAVTIARADLAQARLLLDEEQARAEQAAQDWKKLGLSGQPDNLVLRVPQLASARAAAAAEEARLRQAEIDLERTRILAPYAGRVLEKNVDIGQVVSPGSILARIYAVDYAEIRLPLSNRQLAYLRLPEIRRDGSKLAAPIPVIIHAEVGGTVYEWDGRVVRTEGAIDAESRQWFVVAQVDNPYAPRDDRPPLKVGQFVTAKIEGVRLQDVYLIPQSAMRTDNQVIVVSEENTIHAIPVQVLLEQGDTTVVRGLEPNQAISLTPLPYAGEGATVHISGATDRAPSESLAGTHRDSDTAPDADGIDNSDSPTKAQARQEQPPRQLKGEPDA